MAKADSSLISGMTSGFETGITLLSQQEENKKLQADALDNSSVDMFSKADSAENDMFSMDLTQFAAYLDKKNDSTHDQDSDGAGEATTPDNQQEQQDDNTAQHQASDSENHDMQSQETVGTQSTLQSAPSNASTLQCLRTVAAKRCALDSAYMRFFVSSNRLNICRIEHYKRLKEQHKGAIAVQKMQQKKIQQDLDTGTIQQHVLKLQECKLQLEIFNMESEVLKAAGGQPLLQSTVLPMMMDSLIVNVPHNVPVSTAVDAVTQSDHPPVVLPVVNLPAEELEEVPAPTDVDQIHADIL